MNIHKISTATIARTACLLLALTNQLLSACGKPVLPIESQTVEQLVTAGITTVAALPKTAIHSTIPGDPDGSSGMFLRL